MWLLQIVLWINLGILIGFALTALLIMGKEGEERSVESGGEVSDPRLETSK